MSKTTEQIAQFLTQARKENGLSQHQAAAGSGVSQSLISYYESGRVSPKLDNLLTLCRFYGKPISEVTQAMGVAPDSQN